MAPSAAQVPSAYHPYLARRLRSIATAIATASSLERAVEKTCLFTVA